MIALKYYPPDFTDSRGKQWLKVKKRLKKQFHTQLRRGKMVKPFSKGEEVAW